MNPAYLHGNVNTYSLQTLQGERRECFRALWAPKNKEGAQTPEKLGKIAALKRPNPKNE